MCVSSLVHPHRTWYVLSVYFVTFVFALPLRSRHPGETDSFYSLQSIPTVVYLLVCFQLPCSPPSFALTDRPEHQTNPVDCIFPRDSLNERSFSSLPRYYITLDLYIRISAPGTVRSYSGDIHSSLRFVSCVLGELLIRTPFPYCRGGI